MIQNPIERGVVERAQGCLFGQLSGDSLGSLVEFQSSESIARAYPDGVRDLADGGSWNTLAGQPTDDSEMALALARTILSAGAYDVQRVGAAYRTWLSSGPFDVGATTTSGLTGSPNHDSQANGALMRISPLAIFGALSDRDGLSRWAAADARITHPNPVCVDANTVFVNTIADAIATQSSADKVYARALQFAGERGVEPTVLQAIEAAADNAPKDFMTHQGWVLIALQNAFYRLLHATGPEDGIIDTVGCGGDTDTNATICGALLGAVHGVTTIPERWVKAIERCRPERGRPRVLRPRPEVYWPMDAADLSTALVTAGMER